MSFEDIIDYSEESLRKRSRSETELLWSPHTRNRFGELLHDDERWDRGLWQESIRLWHVPVTVHQPTLGQSLGESALKNFAWTVCGLTTVERVLSIEKDKDEFDVWTVISDFDEETEEKVAEAEVELVKNNPDLRFDFMVIPKRGRNLDQLLPKGNVLYSKK